MRIVRLLATLGVIAGSLLPGGSAALREFATLHINDKVQHFVAYAVLAWLAGCTESRWTSYIWLVGLGVALELMQIFVPGRSCEFGDALADSGGVVCGLILAICVVLLRGWLRRNVPIGCGELDREVQ